jgi:hypothetical protein
MPMLLNNSFTGPVRGLKRVNQMTLMATTLVDVGQIHDSPEGIAAEHFVIEDEGKAQSPRKW